MIDRETMVKMARAKAEKSLAAWGIRIKDRNTEKFEYKSGGQRTVKTVNAIACQHCKVDMGSMPHAVRATCYRCIERARFTTVNS